MKRTTDKFIDQLRNMLDRMFAAEHRTVWHSGDDNKHLIFFTFNEDTARKAINALRDAGCLCEQLLGRSEECIVTEDAKPQIQHDVECCCEECIAHPTETNVTVIRSQDLGAKDHE